MFATKGEAFSPDRPVEWSSVPSVRLGNYIAYDLAPDGKRVITIPPLLADSAGEKSSVPMTVLLNYFDELKRKVPLKP
jgi:hypothetical protein